MNKLTRKLDSVVKRTLNPIAPFSFDGTFYKPSHFPIGDKDFETDIYWQTLNYQDQIYGLKFLNVGSVEVPKVDMSIYYNRTEPDSETIQKISNEIELRFNLRENLEPFYEGLINDDVLRDAFSRWRGMHVSTAYSLYEFLVVTTVLQNTVVRRSVQMMQNLFSRFGTLIHYDNKELFAFWVPEEILLSSEDELRELKVGYRAKTLYRQALEFGHNKLAYQENIESLEKADLRKKLLSIYGVGPATVQYLLFEVFKNYDDIEHLPPWEQKIFSKILYDEELVEPEKILSEIDRRWGKWKMLAIHYLFEDLFWLRKNRDIPWLEKLIRL